MSVYSDYLDICYGEKSPEVRQFSVEQAINAARRDKTSTWQELIEDE